MNQLRMRRCKRPRLWDSRSQPMGSRPSRRCNRRALCDPRGGTGVDPRHSFGVFVVPGNGERPGIKRHKHPGHACSRGSGPLTRANLRAHGGFIAVSFHPGGRLLAKARKGQRDSFLSMYPIYMRESAMPRPSAGQAPDNRSDNRLTTRLEKPYEARTRRVGGEVTQRIANPCRPVRFRYPPPNYILKVILF